MIKIVNKIIVLGVGGGIAAYKACELVRLLVKGGADVHVVMTRAATRFVTPLTLQTLSKNLVEKGDVSLPDADLTATSQGNVPSIDHISLADRADLIVIAPATANLIARAAHGLAGDLLTEILLATKAPVLFCPSMNVNMWTHPATQYNVGRLRELGYNILEPAEGELACGWEGAGRLPEPEAILKAVIQNIDKSGKTAERS